MTAEGGEAVDIVERLKHLVALGDLDAAQALGVEAWRRGDLETLKEASKQPLWRPSEERWKAAPISPRLWQQQALVRIVKHFQNRAVLFREKAHRQETASATRPIKPKGKRLHL